MSGNEDSVQATVQDFDETARLQETVEVTILRLDRLRQQAFGDRVQDAIDDMNDYVLEGRVPLEDVRTGDGDCLQCCERNHRIMM